MKRSCEDLELLNRSFSPTRWTDSASHAPLPPPPPGEPRSREITREDCFHRRHLRPPPLLESRGGAGRVQRPLRQRRVPLPRQARGMQRGEQSGTTCACACGACARRCRVRVRCREGGPAGGGDASEALETGTQGRHTDTQRRHSPADATPGCGRTSTWRSRIAGRATETTTGTSPSAATAATSPAPLCLETRETVGTSSATASRPRRPRPLRRACGGLAHDSVQYRSVMRMTRC